MEAMRRLERIERDRYDRVRGLRVNPDGTPGLVSVVSVQRLPWGQLIVIGGSGARRWAKLYGTEELLFKSWELWAKEQ